MIGYNLAITETALVKSYHFMQIPDLSVLEIEKEMGTGVCCQIPCKMKLSTGLSSVWFAVLVFFKKSCSKQVT